MKALLGRFPTPAEQDSSAALAGAMKVAVMTNDDIIQMIRAGFSEDAVLAAILICPGRLDRSVLALIRLHRAGASDRVLAALLDSDSMDAAGTTGPLA